MLHGNKAKIHIIVHFFVLTAAAENAQRYNRVDPRWLRSHSGHRLALLRCLTVRKWGSNSRMLLMVNPNEPITHTPDALWSNQRPASSTRSAPSIIAPPTGETRSRAETQRTWKLICPLILHLHRNRFHTSSFRWFLNEVYCAPPLWNSSPASNRFFLPSPASCTVLHLPGLFRLISGEAAVLAEPSSFAGRFFMTGGKRGESDGEAGKVSPSQRHHTVLEEELAVRAGWRRWRCVRFLCSR